MKKTKAKVRSPSCEEPLNGEHQKIAQWLKTVRFRKQIFGGVSEADVWKKLDELNRLYDAALAAERIRCETLLAEYRTRDVEAESEDSG